MNVSNISFPKLQLVKPSGRLIKELTTGGKPYLYSWLVEVMITSDIKGIISWIVQICPI